MGPVRARKAGAVNMTRLKMLLLWLLCIAAGLVSALWMLLAIAVSSPRAWPIARGFDQLGNATFGGDEDELISSRCWRCRDQPEYAAWVKVINWLFDDPQHCENAYQGEALRKKWG